MGTRLGLQFAGVDEQLPGFRYDGVERFLRFHRAQGHHIHIGIHALRNRFALGDLRPGLGAVELVRDW